jgi:hypothetical protein
MSLQEATENFTSSLTAAAVNLGSAVNKLQSEWQQVAAASASASAENDRCVAFVVPSSLVSYVHSHAAYVVVLSLFSTSYYMSYSSRRPAAVATNSGSCDPVKLIRRIHALEMAARQIQADCRDMSTQRAAAVQEAVDEVQKNRRLVQKVRLTCFVRVGHLLLWTRKESAWWCRTNDQENDASQKTL